MNGFKFATVPIAKLLTMPSSASKMPGTGSQIGLGKPCVCSRHNAASSGMLQRLANGRSLRKEYRKYERYSGSTSASRRIRSRLLKLKAQDTKSFSRLVAALHSTPSDFSPAASYKIKRSPTSQD